MKHSFFNTGLPVSAKNQIPATTAKALRAGLLPAFAIGIAMNAAAMQPVNAGTGRINSPLTPGFVERGVAMPAGANFRGSLDQLNKALDMFPTASETEKARVAQALAALSVPGADAMKLLEQFLADYPASAWRQTALLGVADAWFDRGEYAYALKAYRQVATDALNSSQADDAMYHEAYCLLKLGDYDAADAIYSRLASSADYANEARFYQGYVAYAKGDYKRAASLLRQVRPDGMPTVTASYYLAQIDFMNANYAEAAKNAIALLKNASLIDDPEFVNEMNRVAGESNYQMGMKDNVIPYLRTYVASAADPLPSARYILGMAEFKDGQYEEAISTLTPVTAHDSAMGQSAFLYIGQSYLKLGNYNAATLALDKAVRMDADKAVQEAAFYNLAVAKMQGGKVPFGSSVAMFEEFLQRYPNSTYAPEVADYVVNGYITDNNYQAALAAINRISNPTGRVLDAKQKVLYTLGTRDLRAGKPESALNYLSQAAAMQGRDAATAAEATLWKGECQYRLGQYKAAVESYNKYLRGNHGSSANRALAYYDLGYARFALKDFADAKADFSRFISNAGATTDKALRADAYNRLADSQYYTSDFAGAAATYEKAFRTNPEAGDYPIYQQGVMKGLRRDYNGKIETLTDMIARFPQSALVPSALLGMGESYGEMGNNARAIETYTMLVNRYPSTAQGRQGELLLAITYLNENDRPGAIEHYKNVIRRYPSSDEARVAADDLKQLYADQGRVSDYVAFINSVPDAPKPETAELARLTLLSAEKASEDGRMADAVASAAELIEKYPDSPQAVQALAIKAESEMRQGKSADALASYQALEKKASAAADINTARMGIMNTSRDLGLHEQTIEAADKLLESSAQGAAGLKEVSFTKALALHDLKRDDEAAEIWSTLAEDIESLHGTKSCYYLAQLQADSGKDAQALATVNRLIEANPPHDYWLARGFILLSDLLRRKGDTFEADEYLRSLRDNYPGNEADIFNMISERLK